MHVFPQLRKLEEKYANEVAVVGVHTPKFPSERETENLRKAVARHELKHPVINDRDYKVWNAYHCRAWPTLTFLTPDGKVIGKHEGEIGFQALDMLLQDMIADFDHKGLMNRRRADYMAGLDEGAGLSFPGKVLADQGAERLFVTDSGHNRVVTTTLEGEVRQIIGSGQAGFQDGDAATARFDHPQGMALVGDQLYVADTENHAIRRVDLPSGRVETVVGTGEQGGRLEFGGPGRQIPLSSPWDLVEHQGTLYIAMAGVHQLWAVDLESGTVRLHAGNGRESPIDGPLAQASLDQPSGIDTDGTLLYFADSEASAIRTASIDLRGRTESLVGRDLFVFGDVDGVGDEVRLQHPLGLCYHQGSLYLADSYNNKIKRMLPLTRGVLTLAGTGEVGHVDGPAGQARFHEPCGVSVAMGVLYVADSNNHAIRTIALEKGEVATLELRGL